jgi:hypothetical protein
MTRFMTTMTCDMKAAAGICSSSGSSGSRAKNNAPLNLATAEAEMIHAMKVNKAAADAAAKAQTEPEHAKGQGKGKSKCESQDDAKTKQWEWRHHNGMSVKEWTAWMHMMEDRTNVLEDRMYGPTGMFGQRWTPMSVTKSSESYSSSSRSRSRSQTSCSNRSRSRSRRWHHRTQQFIVTPQESSRHQRRGHSKHSRRSKHGSRRSEQGYNQRSHQGSGRVKETSKHKQTRTDKQQTNSKH